MKAIDKILEVAGKLEIAKIHVPEWELDIFIKPLTLNDYRALAKKLEMSDEISTAVDALIMLAKDEQGEPVFTIEDKPKLLRAPGQAEIVKRVGDQILNAHDVTDPLA